MKAQLGDYAPLKPVFNTVTKKIVEYDYDGDCNYCDDSNCTNGECKELV